MGLDLAAIPVALLAGVVGVLSPCVWPLVPLIMASSADSGRSGPLALALGLATSFGLAGSVLSALLISLQIDPELFRYLAATAMVIVALPLLIPFVGEKVTQRLSRLTARLPGEQHAQSARWGQFGVGALLGLVWLPCVGPTLGAAIALASMGQQLSLAFAIMFAFGLGTALALTAAAWISSAALQRVRPEVMQGGSRGKQLLGFLLLMLGLSVLSSVDKRMEAWAMELIPAEAMSW